jgi:predicted transcriptional regulator
MCWNFCNLMFSMGDSKEEAYRAMSDFNSDFQIPLPPSKVRSARTKRVYKLTERTFYAQFNLEPEHTKDAEYSREYSRAYRVEKKRILTEKGKTFQQQREKKKARAKELRSLGLSADEIAIELGVSKRSVYYYLKEEPKNDVPVAKPVAKPVLTTDTNEVVSNLLDSLCQTDTKMVQSVDLKTQNLNFNDPYAKA